MSTLTEPSPAGTTRGAGTATSKDTEPRLDETRRAPSGGAMEKKAVHDAAAYIRSLAQLRGRNAEWAERAVREMGTSTLDEAAQYPHLARLHPTRQELADALRDMLALGYLRHPIEGDREYVNVTDNAVRQIDKDGVTVYPGDVWSFVMQDVTAYYPVPADGACDVSPAPTLTWMPGASALRHHVYFADDPNAVAAGAASARSRGSSDTGIER